MKRYFYTDYDQISERYMGPMDHYITVTQAILGSTCYMSLNQADVTLKQDKGGNFESAEGKVTLALNTEDDGIRMLDISFRLDASDFGGSEVAVFNPDDYGVKLAEGYSEEPSALMSLDPETQNSVLKESKSRWERAGYTVDQTMSGYVDIDYLNSIPGDEKLRVEYMNEDWSAYWIYITDSEGNMLELENVTNDWQAMFDDWSESEYPDQELVRETTERVYGWLAEENPVLSAGTLSLTTNTWYQNGDEVYFIFIEDAAQADHAWNPVDLMVRVAPEWRIEFFSCIGNG